MDTTEPALPSGLKLEPTPDEFEVDYEADEAPEGNIQPDKVQINVDDFQEATNVDTAGFLARATGQPLTVPRSASVWKRSRPPRMCSRSISRRATSTSL